MPEKIRILLVDDEPNILKMVGKRLEVEGFEVLLATDGRQALTRVELDAPQCIILDVMLPQLNGYEVCAKLKQDPRHQHIPIILFSARAQEKDEQLGMACGANAYVRKPFQAQELVGHIRALVRPPPSPT